MKNTYEQAIVQVLKDEGGYTNESTDPGGPTNWGITIEDAKKYWKQDATSEDVKTMPKTVAEEIYRQHYANAIHYDELPAGVDYAVLDYAINSGISRSSRLLQRLVNVQQDGSIGPVTLTAVSQMDPISLIRAIYTERMAFLKKLSIWPIYKKGWTSRCNNGVLFAISLATATKPVSWWQKLLNTLRKLLKGN